MIASWQTVGQIACQNKLSCALAQGFGKLCGVCWKYISREPWQHQAGSRLSCRSEGKERGHRRRAGREGEPVVRRGSGNTAHHTGAQEVELGWELTARKALRSKHMKDLGEG